MSRKSGPRTRSRRSRRKSGKSQWAHARERWEHGAPLNHGQIVALRRQAFARRLDPIALADLLTTWSSERSDEPPAELHDLEEVLVS